MINNENNNNNNNNNIIYACTSEKSQSGLSRIINLITPDINVYRIKESSDINKYYCSYSDNFKIILHNITNAEPEIQTKSIVFGMQTLIYKLIHNQEVRDHFRNYPPLALWVNSETAAQKLTSKGFNVKVMYRPNQVIIPDQYIVMPKRKQVLWYWKEDDPDLNRHWKIIIKTVNELPDIKFLFFPSESPPVIAKNAIAIGGINISKYIKKVRGMVRISNKFDLGRVMFDIAACGRWVLTYKLREPFTHAISKLSQLPDAIRFCLDNYDDKKGMELWNYARENFAEDVLRKRWISEVNGSFQCLNSETKNY